MTCWKRSAALAAALLVLAAAGACNRNTDPTTPEAKKAKGEELLKKVSAQLAGATAIKFTAVQTLEETRSGKLVSRVRTVNYSAQRPDKAHFVFAPEGGGTTDVWYDGATEKITLAHHKEKAWARGPMPKTLDAALDAAATEYDITTPVADFIYSAPYDAFAQSGLAGGWVAKETVNGQVCHKLSYENENVSWDLWVSDGEKPMPCQLKIAYKQSDNAAKVTAVLKDWNLGTTFPADEFTPKVDEQAYSRIYLMRAPTAEPEGAVDAATTDAPADAPAPSPDKK